MPKQEYSDICKQLMYACEDKDDRIVSDALWKLSLAHQVYLPSPEGGFTTLPMNYQPDADTDHLIELIHQRDIADTEKSFLIFRKNQDGSYRLEEKDYAGLLNEVEEPTDEFAKPEEPTLSSLGLFTWLRHKLSFLFGEPEAVKVYNRRMEIYENKKKDLVREKFGYNDFSVDPDLLDKGTARNYGMSGQKMPLAENAVEEPVNRENNIRLENNEPQNENIGQPQNENIEPQNELNDHPLVNNENIVPNGGGSVDLNMSVNDLNAPQDLNVNNDGRQIPPQDDKPGKNKTGGDLYKKAAIELLDDVKKGSITGGTVQRGAERLKTLINEGGPECEDLIKELATIQMKIKPPANDKDKRVVLNDLIAVKIRDKVKNFCGEAGLKKDPKKWLAGEKKSRLPDEDELKMIINDPKNGNLPYHTV